MRFARIVFAVALLESGAAVADPHAVRGHMPPTEYIERGSRSQSDAPTAAFWYFRRGQND